MTIAMLATWLDGWYQTQLWRGAYAACRVHGTRLLCLVGYARASHPAPTGPEGIFGLAARGSVDGVLLSAGPLTYWEGHRAIDNILAWLPKIPSISLGQEHRDLPSIVPDGGGIGELVRHLALHHKCEHIAFIGGPPTNSDSDRRLADFIATCNELGIQVRQELIEPGFFYLEAGEAAMGRILSRQLPLDAVVCANDAMALGAARALARANLNVPENVKLVGYDDCEESRSHQPPLTTIRSPTYQIGFRGLERCIEELEHKSGALQRETHPTSMVVRKSCGCLTSSQNQASGLMSSSLRSLPTVSRVAELMTTEDSDQKHRFLRDFLGTLRDSQEGELEEWQDILFAAARLALRNLAIGPKRQVVEETILQAHALLSEAREGLHSGQRRAMDGLVRQLHITMNNLQSDLTMDGFAHRLAKSIEIWCKESRIFLFSETCQPMSGQNLATCEFESRWSLLEGKATPISDSDGLLPPEEGVGEIWIGLPLEHAEFNFGVILFRNWPHSESFVEHMRLVVSNFIHSIWRREEDKKRQTELHELSIHDQLTGLYNRRGFLEVGEKLVAITRREGKRLGVLMADLDGLKAINDTYGHSEGDLAIVALGDALRESLRTSDTMARLGGDEFAAIFPIGENQQETEVFDRIREALAQRSQALNRPWVAKSSLGIHIWDPCDGRTLGSALSEADAELYRDKKDRKTFRT